MLTPRPFPFELWDEIVHYLYSSRDLLSLALVSRFFSSIIIPYHIEYRTICCDLRRGYIWSHLNDHRRCAKGIQRLELIDEEDYQIQVPPSVIEPEDPYEKESAATSLLSKALSYMSRLETFEWKYVPGTISNISDISRSLTNKSIINLRGLSVKFDWPENTQDSTYVDDLNFFPIWQLDNLTKVFLTYPCQSAQEMIIRRCPNLIDLYLCAPSNECICSSVLENGHWMKLRRLSLGGNLALLPQNEPPENQKTIATDFFLRQTNLESLLLDIPFMPASFLNSSLQMLRSVSWTVSVSSTISSLLSALDLSRIVHYRTTTRDIDPFARMDSLETLQIKLDRKPPPDLQFFFRNAPNLRRLSLRGTVHARTVKDLIASLVAYSNITHVYFASVFGPAEVRKLPRKFSKIKTLQYIQVFNDQQDLFLEIDRNSDGRYFGYHFILSPEVDPNQHPSEWGNFFREL